MSLFNRTRHGILHLEFGLRRGQYGPETFLRRDKQKTPLMIIRPFPLPCGTLMVFIVNPTGGVFGGDTSEIVVQAEAGTRVLVLTQSATRIQPYRTDDVAVQDIHFKVAGGARLEYYPERTIPFAGSRFRQTIHADLEDGAEFGCTETFSTGRVQSGERLAFALYESRVEVRQGGRRVYLDRQRVVPDEHLRAPGLLGTADYVASGVWVGGGEVSEWPTLPGELSTGRTASGAVWLRGVAGRGPVLDARLNAACEQLRGQLFGAVPLKVRR